MICRYRVGVTTVAMEVSRYKLELVGVQVVMCGVHGKFVDYSKNLSVVNLCNWVQRIVED